MHERAVRAVIGRRRVQIFVYLQALVRRPAVGFCANFLSTLFVRRINFPTLIGRVDLNLISVVHSQFLNLANSNTAFQRGYCAYYCF